MSTLSPAAFPVPAGPQLALPATARPAFAVTNTVAMTILFGSQLGFLCLSLIWAASGLLHLAPVIAIAFGAVAMGLAAWATAWVARQTWRYERSAGV